MTLKSLLTACFVAVAIAGCRGGGEKVYSVDELANAAVAQKEAFMGKEVMVAGYTGPPSDDNRDGYTLGLDFDPFSPIERQLSCIVPHGQPPKGLEKKWGTVKGTIANIHSQNYMDLKSIKLEPCEVIRAE